MNTRRRFLPFLPTLPFFGPLAIKAATVAQGTNPRIPEWVARVIHHPLLRIAPQRTQTYVLDHTGDSQSREWFTQLVVKDNGARWLQRWQVLNGSTNHLQEWTL